MILKAIRPVWGKSTKPHGGEVKIPRDQEVRHISNNVYEVHSIRTTRLSPPTVTVDVVRFTLNPHIAAADLREV